MLVVYQRFFPRNETDVDGGIAEIVSSIFDTTTKTFSSPVNITTNNIWDSHPTICSDISSGVAVALWYSDLDNEILDTANDRNVMFAVYNISSQTWSAPGIVMANIRIQNAASCAIHNGVVVATFVLYSPSSLPGVSQKYNFSSAMGPADQAIYLTHYNIAEGSWSTPYNLTKIEFAYDARNGKPLWTIKDMEPCVAVHDEKFVIAWVRNGSAIYQIWTEATQHEPILVISNYITEVVNSLSLVSGGDYLIASWSNNVGNNTGFSYAVMEKEGVTFGNAVNKWIEEPHWIQGFSGLAMLGDDAFLHVSVLKEEIVDNNHTSAQGRAKSVYQIFPLVNEFTVMSTSVSPAEGGNITIVVNVMSKGLFNIPAGGYSFILKDGNLNASTYTIETKEGTCIIYSHVISIYISI